MRCAFINYAKNKNSLALGKWKLNPMKSICREGTQKFTVGQVSSRAEIIAAKERTEHKRKSVFAVSVFFRGQYNSAPFQFIETNANTFSQRFYRAKIWPQVDPQSDGRLHGGASVLASRCSVGL